MITSPKDAEMEWEIVQSIGNRIVDLESDSAQRIDRLRIPSINHIAEHRIEARQQANLRLECPPERDRPTIYHLTGERPDHPNTGLYWTHTPHSRDLAVNPQ
jgi:hypothetical protein